jgi:nucleotide-binding universal stress UspA family protein
MYKKILVPLDGSTLAECVLPHVTSFRDRFPESRFDFVRVVEPIAMYLNQETYSGSVDKLKVMESARTSNAKEYLSRVLEMFPNDGAKFNTEILVGRAADKLAEYAENNEVDLIIIATHGRSGVRRWVRGSVADRILHFSHVPVLMVRAGEIIGSV